jgi:hypothetical protein
MLFSITEVCNDIELKGLATTSESLHYVIFPLRVCKWCCDYIYGGEISSSIVVVGPDKVANHPWLGLCGPDTLNCCDIIL